eukprot:675038-Rhodomonas_salina.2
MRTCLSAANDPPTSSSPRCKTGLGRKCNWVLWKQRKEQKRGRRGWGGGAEEEVNKLVRFSSQHVHDLQAASATASTKNWQCNS